MVPLRGHRVRTIPCRCGLTEKAARAAGRMDISDDLCRSDFFDLVPMPLDPKFGDGSSHNLMPVTLIESSDYAQPDGNNNLGGTTGHIKSFLDEMFLSDPINGPDGGQSIGTLNSSTFEVLGTLQWYGDGANPGQNSSDTANNGEDGSPPTSDPNGWFISSGFNSEGEVTTLTNLIDPLFVTYEDEHCGNVTIKAEPVPVESRVVSSDLISSTFLSDPNAESPAEISRSSTDTEMITWRKSPDAVGNGGSGSVYCDDSLLRTALQSGNNSSSNSSNANSNKIVKLTAVVASSNNNNNNNVPSSNEMTELRKVLSFPPLTSPTSSTTENTPNGAQSSQTDAQPSYYELKVIDPLFGDDANIPNMEELIMTRIDPPFGGYQPSQPQQGKQQDQKKKLDDISERKVNSTTLSTKWTYTTTNDQGKAPRRRTKKNNNNNNNNGNFTIKKGSKGPDGVLNGGDMVDKTNGLPNGGSPGGQLNGPNSNGAPNNGGNGIRKERSLHYCNICCKGFKDKYSVNVHVRTHTGEKPFSCNLCGKNFRQKAHLAKHYQTHAAKAQNQQNKPPSKR